MNNKDNLKLTDSLEAGCKKTLHIYWIVVICHLPQLCLYSEKFKKNVRKIRPRPHLRFWRPSLEISAALTWVFGGPHLSFWRRPLIGWSRQASLEILAGLTWVFGTVALFFWPFYQISRCRGRVEMNGIHHSNQHDKLYNLNATCIFSELSL